MLKIVEIHSAESVQNEYIVLQNQGVVTVNLKGWAVCTDAYLLENEFDMKSGMYVFRMSEEVKPYTHIVLFTGAGQNGWVPTNDGRLAYCAYWGNSERVWSEAKNIHVLQLVSSRTVREPQSSSLTK